MLFGALYGLGLTVSVWLPLSSPGLRSAEALLFAGLAGLAGALTGDLARRWGVFSAYPAILAAQLVHGVGAAVLAGTIASLVWVLLGSGRARKERSSRLLLEASKLALAAALAGLLFALVPAWKLVAHACSFAAVDLALSGVAGRWATPRWRASSRRELLPHAVGPAVTCPVGWLVALAYTEAHAGSWLLLLPWTMAAIHLGRRLAQRTGRCLPAPLTGRSTSIYRSLTLGLARAASSTDPELAGHQQRVEWMSRAVGERLGLPRMEVEAVSAAALLHESDRIWLLDAPAAGGDLATHPTLAAEIVSMIRYPYAVLPIVRHARERWDGAGRPDGLVGEAIPRGARILAAADYLDSITSGRRDGRPVSPESAVARLRAEAGSRLDPVVVDLLVEHMQDHGQPWESRWEQHALQTV